MDSFMNVQRQTDNEFLSNLLEKEGCSENSLAEKSPVENSPVSFAQILFDEKMFLF